MKTTYRYNYGINFLRAFAIVAIVLYHIFPIEIKGGYLGVNIFFLISGYLLGQKTEDDFENGRYRPRKFYIKKALRLYPQLYVMVMSVVAFNTLFFRELLLGVREELASIFLAYNNWWQMMTQASYFMKMGEHSPFTHLWYLGVEIQLLILWPILFYCYKKVKEKWQTEAAWIFAVLAMISGVLMCILYRPDNINRVYYGTDTRAFAFFIGVFLGIKEDGWQDKITSKMSALEKAKQEAWKRRGRICFVLMLLVDVLLFIFVKGENGWLYQGGMFAICLWFAFSIFLMNVSLQTKGEEPTKLETYMMQNSLVQWIGKNSYLIYLWHYPLIFLFYMR